MLPIKTMASAAAALGAAAAASIMLAMPATGGTGDCYNGDCIAKASGINIRPAPSMTSYFPDRPTTVAGAHYTAVDGETGESHPLVCGERNETLGWHKIQWGSGVAYLAQPCLEMPAP